PAPAAKSAGNGAAGPVESAKPAVSSVDGNRVFASPLARRIAKDAGVEVSAITGSGPHGRVVKADVEAAIAGGAKPAAVAAAAPT
ncbi:E3 binding domain-containing protein, partial [Rhizobiaceae sp. 2RAB30]